MNLSATGMAAAVAIGLVTALLAVVRARAAVIGAGTALTGAAAVFAGAAALAGGSFSLVLPGVLPLSGVALGLIVFELLRNGNRQPIHYCRLVLSYLPNNR